MGLDVYMTRSNKLPKNRYTDHEDEEELYFRKAWGLIEYLYEINKDLNDTMYGNDVFDYCYMIIDVEHTKQKIFKTLLNGYNCPYENKGYYIDGGDLFDTDFAEFVKFLILTDSKYIHIYNSY